MGLLADIYVSRDDEAVKYDDDPGGFADRAEYKRFTELELSTLWCIMRGVQWDVSLMHQFPSVFQEDEGQRTINRLPAEMVAELSRLTPEQIAVVSPKWAATEELRWLPDTAREVITDLVRLSRTASETGRNVYLWNCV